MKGLGHRKGAVDIEGYSLGGDNWVAWSCNLALKDPVSITAHCRVTWPLIVKFIWLHTVLAAYTNMAAKQSQLVFFNKRFFWSENADTLKPKLFMRKGQFQLNVHVVCLPVCLSRLGLCCGITRFKSLVWMRQSKGINRGFNILGECPNQLTDMGGGTCSVSYFTEKNWKDLGFVLLWNGKMCQISQKFSQVSKNISHPALLLKSSYLSKAGQEDHLAECWLSQRSTCMISVMD